MTEIPEDPYRPSWIDGPHRPEDGEYLLELARPYRGELARDQAHEISNAHRLLVLRAERDRALEHAAIILLGAAARGADVHEMVAKLLSTEDGVRVLVETAVRPVRLLGSDHLEEITEILDAFRRISEGEW